MTVQAHVDVRGKKLPHFILIRLGKVNKRPILNSDSFLWSTG